MSDNNRSESRISRRGFLALAGAAGIGAALVACGPGSSTDPTSPGGSTNSGDGEFAGTTVRVAVGSFSTTGVKIFLDDWQKKTGARVELIEIPFGDLYSKLHQAFSSRVDAYDLIVYAGGWVSGFANSGYISSLEDYYADDPEWQNVLPQVQALAYVGESRYTVPLDGDVFMMYYRKDAFEHPEAASRFEAEYGRALRVPQTWAEYRECAEFFTGWDWADNGQACYGVLEAMKPKDVGGYVLASRAAAYGAHPSKPGSLFFDPETMEPQVGNPAWEQALQNWIDIVPFGPSQMITYGGGDLRGNFVAGNYALAIDWPDIGILAQDPAQSQIKDLIGYAKAPGAEKVWNQDTEAWEDLTTPNEAPYFGWGGWHASIAETSPVKDAAWSLARHLDSTENALTAVTTPGTARGPYRQEHFVAANWTAEPLTFANAEQYLSVQLESFNHPNSQFDLRIPEAGRYIDALDTAASLAVAGSRSAADALADCAEQWATITQEIGFDEQHELYRKLQVAE